MGIAGHGVEKFWPDEGTLEIFNVFVVYILLPVWVFGSYTREVVQRVEDERVIGADFDWGWTERYALAIPNTRQSRRGMGEIWENACER